ncbi:MAG TPA: hypothetical protein VG477_01800, partial [Thermoanaerobaculia bacterium]|nr:hypothetical protein [Thermoanaerobaculia bacterium]
MLDHIRSGIRRYAFPASLALLVSIPPAAAVTVPPMKEKPATVRMLDARVNLPGAFERAAAARGTAATEGLTEARQAATASATAITRLRQAMPGLDVKLSNLTGGPDTVRNKRGGLTAAAPGRDSESIVREFLRQNSAVYGLSTADLADLVVLGDSPGGSSGLRMLRMEQRIDGRPIFQSETRFLLDRDGRLMKSTGLMVPNARVAASRVQTNRLMAPGDALSRLMAYEGRTVDPTAFK